MRIRTQFAALAVGLLPVCAAVAQTHPVAGTSLIDDFTTNCRQDNGQPITGATPPTELLREAALLNPIVDPAGGRINLGSWNSVTGRVDLECKGRGTLIKVTVDHLIPNGVYTMWIFTLPTGVPPSGFGGVFDDRTGDNAFVADENGHGSFQATLPAGLLTTRGSVTNCLLDNRFFALIGNYHIDGLTYGTSPGDPGTNAEQFSAAFMQPAVAAITD